MLTIDLIEIAIEIVILAIFIPFIYVKLVSGFVKEVIGRLINANFSMNRFKFLNLYIGYMAGALLFTYIFHQLFKHKIVEIDSTKIPFIISVAALSFCFIARVITRESGHVYGKQYIAAVTSLASILFLINTFSGIVTNGYNTSLFSVFYEGLLSRISSTLIFSKDSLDFIFLGSIGTATVGEYLLMKTKPNIRSIPIALEKFPSDFMVITGDKGITNKMREMTDPQKKINSLKMITRTLESYKNISDNLKTNATMRNEEYKTENFKIIAPTIDKEKIKDIYFRKPYIQFPLRYLSRLKRFNLLIEKELQERIKSYEHRKDLLNEMSDAKIIQWKDKDLKNFRLLIVNNREAIVTILGTHNSDEKIGLFTKEPYLIECFNTFFDKIWQN